MDRPVRFFFDFISIYSWLAMDRAEDLAAEHGIRWELRPILYAGLLDRTGGFGAGEDPRRRAHAIRDAQRVAHRLGLEFVGPPRHPFISLAALRLQTAACLDEPDRALPLARELFAAAWQEGRDLTDFEVLEDVARRVGLTLDLDRLQARPVKKQLAAWGVEAFEEGLFGVPTFIAPDGELFYGQDRMDDLIDHLAGRGPASYRPDSAPGTRRPAVEAWMSRLEEPPGGAPNAR
jgi:2-hydroxychromene-2-carboxylate isomerase